MTSANRRWSSWLYLTEYLQNGAGLIATSPAISIGTPVASTWVAITPPLVRPGASPIDPWLWPPSILHPCQGTVRPPLLGSRSPKAAAVATPLLALYGRRCLHGALPGAAGQLGGSPEPSAAKPNRGIRLPDGGSSSSGGGRGVAPPAPADPPPLNPFARQDAKHRTRRAAALAAASTTADAAAASDGDHMRRSLASAVQGVRHAAGKVNRISAQDGDRLRGTRDPGAGGVALKESEVVTGHQGPWTPLLELAEVIDPQSATATGGTMPKPKEKEKEISTPIQIPAVATAERGWDGEGGAASPVATGAAQEGGADCDGAGRIPQSPSGRKRRASSPSPGRAPTQQGTKKTKTGPQPEQVLEKPSSNPSQPLKPMQAETAPKTAAAAAAPAPAAVAATPSSWVNPYTLLVRNPTAALAWLHQAVRERYLESDRRHETVVKRLVALRLLGLGWEEPLATQAYEARTIGALDRDIRPDLQRIVPRYQPSLENFFAMLSADPLFLVSPSTPGPERALVDIRLAAFPHLHLCRLTLSQLRRRARSAEAAGARPAVAPEPSHEVAASEGSGVVAVSEPDWEPGAGRPRQQEAVREPYGVPGPSAAAGEWAVGERSGGGEPSAKGGARERFGGGEGGGAGEASKRAAAAKAAAAPEGVLLALPARIPPVLTCLVGAVSKRYIPFRSPDDWIRHQVATVLLRAAGAPAPAAEAARTLTAVAAHLAAKWSDGRFANSTRVWGRTPPSQELIARVLDADPAFIVAYDTQCPDPASAASSSAATAAAASAAAATDATTAKLALRVSVLDPLRHFLTAEDVVAAAKIEAAAAAAGVPKGRLAAAAAEVAPKAVAQAGMSEPAYTLDGAGGGDGSVSDKAATTAVTPPQFCRPSVDGAATAATGGEGREGDGGAEAGGGPLAATRRKNLGSREAAAADVATNLGGNGSGGGSGSGVKPLQGRAAASNEVACPDGIEREHLRLMRLVWEVPKQQQQNAPWQAAVLGALDVRYPPDRSPEDWLRNQAARLLLRLHGVRDEGARRQLQEVGLLVRQLRGVWAARKTHLDSTFPLGAPGRPPYDFFAADPVFRLRPLPPSSSGEGSDILKTVFLDTHVSRWEPREPPAPPAPPAADRLAPPSCGPEAVLPHTPLSQVSLPPSHASSSPGSRSGVRAAVRTYPPEEAIMRMVGRTGGPTVSGEDPPSESTTTHAGTEAGTDAGMNAADVAATWTGGSGSAMTSLTWRRVLQSASVSSPAPLWSSWLQPSLAETEAAEAAEATTAAAQVARQAVKELGAGMEAGTEHEVKKVAMEAPQVAQEVSEMATEVAVEASDNVRTLTPEELSPSSSAGRNFDAAQPSATATPAFALEPALSEPAWVGGHPPSELPGEDAAVAGAAMADDATPPGAEAAVSGGDNKAVAAAASELRLSAEAPLGSPSPPGASLGRVPSPSPAGAGAEAGSGAGLLSGDSEGPDFLSVTAANVDRLTGATSRLAAISQLTNHQLPQLQQEQQQQPHKQCREPLQQPQLQLLRGTTRPPQGATQARSRKVRIDPWVTAEGPTPSPPAPTGAAAGGSAPPVAAIAAAAVAAAVATVHPASPASPTRAALVDRLLRPAAVLYPPASGPIAWLKYRLVGILAEAGQLSTSGRFAAGAASGNSSTRGTAGGVWGEGGRGGRGGRVSGVGLDGADGCAPEEPLAGPERTSLRMLFLGAARHLQAAWELQSDFPRDSVRRLAQPGALADLLVTDPWFRVQPRPADVHLRRAMGPAASSVDDLELDLQGLEAAAQAAAEAAAAGAGGGAASEVEASGGKAAVWGTRSSAWSAPAWERYSAPLPPDQVAGLLLGLPLERVKALVAARLQQPTAGKRKAPPPPHTPPQSPPPPPSVGSEEALEDGWHMALLDLLREEARPRSGEASVVAASVDPTAASAGGGGSSTAASALAATSSAAAPAVTPVAVACNVELWWRLLSPHMWPMLRGEPSSSSSSSSSSSAAAAGSMTRGERGVMATGAQGRLSLVSEEELVGGLGGPESELEAWFRGGAPGAEAEEAHLGAEVQNSGSRAGSGDEVAEALAAAGGGLEGDPLPLDGGGQEGEIAAAAAAAADSDRFGGTTAAGPSSPPLPLADALPVPSPAPSFQAPVKVAVEIICAPSDPRLAQLLAHATRCSHVAVDCEMSDRSLSLIQIFAPRTSGRRGYAPTAYLVDLVAAGSARERYGIMRALAPLLTRSQTVKVLHSSNKDILFLRSQYGIQMAPVLDTQQVYGVVMLAWTGAPYISSQLLKSLPGVGLELMLQAVGVRHDTKAPFKKLYERDPAVWSRRPLTDDMIRYAVQDVVHLMDAYRALLRHLLHHPAAKPAFLMEPRRHRQVAGAVPLLRDMAHADRLQELAKQVRLAAVAPATAPAPAPATATGLDPSDTWGPKSATQTSAAATTAGTAAGDVAEPPPAAAAAAMGAPAERGRRPPPVLGR